MLTGWLWGTLYRLLRVVQVACWATGALLAYSSQIGETGWGKEDGLGPVWPQVEWLAGAAPGLLGPLAIVVGLSAVARARLQPPWVRAAIQQILDTWQDGALGAREGELHHNRVTLFKAVRWGRFLMRWPWCRCLVPVARSGPNTQRTRVYFCIPDDADNRQGVAGRAWNSRTNISVSDLPCISRAVEDGVLATYAAPTGMSVQQVRTKRPRARSYMGLPVEVDGRTWGVVVLDSRSPDQIGMNHGKLYGSYLASISLILGRSRK